MSRPCVRELVGDRRAAAVTRAEAEALDRGDALAHFRERFVIEGPVIYADGNSLGRLPEATIERLAKRRRHVGLEARDRVARLDRSPARGGRPAGRGRARRESRRGARVRLDDRQPVQARRGRARAQAGRARDGRRQLPDRPVRARRARRARGLRRGSDRRADRRRRRARVRRARRLGRLPLPRRVSLGGTRRRSRDHRRRTRRRRTRPAGREPLGRRGSDRARVGGSRPRRRLHVQVPERRPRLPRVPLRARRAAGGAALTDLGLVRPARAVRDGTRLRPGPGHRPLPRRDAVDPRARRRRGRCGARPGSGNRGAPPKERRADRARRRPCTTSASRSWGSSSAHRATRSSAAATCRSATPMRGASAER